jgi:hypothetical protein
MFALIHQLWKEQKNPPQLENYQKIITKKTTHQDMI